MKIKKRYFLIPLLFLICAGITTLTKKKQRKKSLSLRRHQNLIPIKIKKSKSKQQEPPDYSKIDKMVLELEAKKKLIKIDKIASYANKGFYLIPFVWKYFLNCNSYLHPYFDINLPSKAILGNDLLDFLKNKKCILEDKWSNLESLGGSLPFNRINLTFFRHGQIINLKCITKEEFIKFKLTVDSYEHCYKVIFDQVFLFTSNSKFKNVVFNFNWFKMVVFSGKDSNGINFTENDLEFRLKSAFFKSFLDCKIKKKLIYYKLTQ